ncbi:DUF2884 family protein [Gallaecimonas kandeliae]|uniref:DUF2884 family protein n=1 Tax=Gallaecimonas kandeliae TaxID=3029055 RepID=UPI002647750F|nr:DUF2884 family protein [Gallaecimonas kandeliae]WKE66168.1 DUF2884 family protein [Gallaecimonas kandeliae]
MNKMIIALPLLALSTLASAKSHHIDTDDGKVCNLSIAHDLVLSGKGFRVEDKSRPLMVFEQGKLTIDGKDQPLSDSQRQQLESFSHSLADSASKGAELALKAIDLADKVTQNVLHDIAGQDAADEVGEGLAEARTHLKGQLYQQDGSWHIKAGAWDGDEDNFLGKDFDARIESAVKKSMGNIFMQLGKAMASGDGSMEENVQAWADGIQAKADKIEKEADAMGDELGAQGDALCTQITALDAQEEGFKQSFNGWVEILN